eukprot:2464740-Pyramimonas_sp.AAC.1
MGNDVNSKIWGVHFFSGWSSRLAHVFLWAVKSPPPTFSSVESLTRHPYSKTIILGTNSGREAMSSSLTSSSKTTLPTFSPQRYLWGSSAPARNSAILLVLITMLATMISHASATRDLRQLDDHVHRDDEARDGTVQRWGPCTPITSPLCATHAECILKQGPGSFCAMPDRCVKF